MMPVSMHYFNNRNSLNLTHLPHCKFSIKILLDLNFLTNFIKLLQAITFILNLIFISSKFSILKLAILFLTLVIIEHLLNPLQLQLLRQEVMLKNIFNKYQQQLQYQIKIIFNFYSILFNHSNQDFSLSSIYLRRQVFIRIKKALQKINIHLNNH